MPGARIVWNSRYFHIAKVGEKADGKHCMTKDAAMGLVNYVGTREGVELNAPEQMKLDGTPDTPLNLDPLKLRPEVASKPATSKQLDTIKKLLEQFPETKNTFEYEDFKANSTIGNASELISRAAEIGMGYAVGIGEATNLVEYVGKRPGADRVGEHGLFSSSPIVDIQKAQEDIASCKGNIWTHIVFLRREDADALGYDHQKPWRDLVMQKVDIIAKSSNIPVSELHWYAGMHNTTHHPHIHLFVFSDNPKAGKLTVQGINKMKQEFSKEIFAEERLHIYEHKTEVRDEIKSRINSILAGVENNESDQFSKKELDALCVRLLHLSHDLEEKTGKLQYGWLKKDLNIRSQVDGILSDLAKAPAIQELYKLYCEDHKDLQRMYRNDPKDIDPLIKNKEFDSMKNKIIQEAVKLGKARPDFVPGNGSISESADQDNTDPGYNEGIPVNYDTDGSPLLSDDESLFASVPEERPQDNPPEEFDQPAGWEPQEDYEQEVLADNHKQKEPEIFDQCLDKAMDGDSSARYRLAKRYFYGKDVEQDFIQAQMWYGLAAEGGNNFAKYELGKMYLYGIGIEKNPQLGKEYCLDAYWSLRYCISDRYGYDVGQHVDRGTTDEICGIEKAGYLMYCLGRMEYAGEGVEQDYGKAFRWFQLAADSSHVHSNYCLAKMYYGGEGIPQNYYNAKYFYEQAAKGKDKYAYYALGKMYDTGTGAEQDYSKASEWYLRASQENVPYADYRLAEMFSAGQGVEKDTELSEILYRKALNEFKEQEKQQPNAADEFRIANMYLKGLGVEANPEEAVKWLELCCEKNDPRAQYQLANLYQDGQAIGQDESKSQELYAAALAGFLLLEQETPSAYIEYKIAGMYDRGNGTEPDAARAFSWYVKAAEAGHPHAAYKAGKCCFEGNGMEQDFKSAEKWFIKAAQGGDSYAMYALGKLYRDGTIVETDLSASYSYFLAAAELGHEFAQFAVAKALLYGTGTEQNSQLAMVFLKKCAKQRNHFAEYLIAEQLSNEKKKAENEKEAQEYYAAALEGFLQLELETPDNQLEYRIAIMYLDGKGTVKNTLKALEWLKLSAEKKNHRAEYQIAELYHEGKSVKKDMSEAQRYYALALEGFIEQEQEAPDAQLEYRIGIMYLKGKGVKKNIDTALFWLNLSAKNGNHYAEYQIAELYEDGDIVERDEEKAHELYAAALEGFLQQEKDNPDAQLEYRIGNMYLKGKGAKKDVNTALFWLNLSAKNGNHYAEYQIAELYEDGDIVEKDEEKAHELYAAALEGFLEQEKDNPDAQLEYRIGNMYLKGKGTEKSIDTALSWFTLSAENGNHYAEYEMAELYEKGRVVEKDESKARKLYASALEGFLQQEEDDPDAQLEYRIGSMYLNGKGTTKDEDTALKWFLLSAEKHNHYAEYQVGQIYENKKGVLNSDITAIAYYKRALKGFIDDDRKNPDKEAEFRIGMMFYRGKGSNVDYAAAYKWVSMSAEKGNAYAQFQMARMLEKGEGVYINKQQSEELYWKAFQGFQKDWEENGNPDALYKIGTMHEFGLGMEKDAEAAKECYEQAAAVGCEAATERLKQIEEYDTSVAIHSVFGLLRAFSRGLGNNIQDSTTRKYRLDHKQLLKQRQLKAAHGQKEELEQTT